MFIFRLNGFEMKLNKEQIKAVTASESSVMILAGAGTGKTTSIVYRIKYLIEELNIDPSSILVMTYTVKAADNMTNSITKNIGSKGDTVESKNFHSFLLDLLSKHYNYADFKSMPRLIDDSMIGFLISEKYNNILALRSKKFSLDKDYSIKKLRSIFSSFSDNLISNKKLDLIRYDISSMINNSDDKSLIENCNQLIDAIDIFPLYTNWKREINAIDFGDIIYYSYKILNDNESVLNEYRNKYKYIFIDEFQDSYLALLKIMDLMVGSSTSITVVGDDDQSIYSFKGASRYNLSGFREIYGKEDFLSVELFTNYRSTQDILDLSNCLISQSSNRLKKTYLQSPNKSTGKIDLLIGTKDAQLDFISCAIKEKLSSGKEIAVLTRTNSQLDFVKDYFKFMDIPVADSSIKLYSLSLSKDIMRMINILSYRGILSTYSIYHQISKLYKIPYNEISLLGITFVNGTYYYKKDARVDSFFDFINDLIATSSKDSLHKTIDIILKFINPDKNELNSMVYDKYHTIINEYYNIYSSRGFRHFSRYINIKIFSSETLLDIHPKHETVRAMTVHKSKGKEFDIVFIPFLTSGSFPLNYSSDRWPVDAIANLAANTFESFDHREEHIEEERRIFFVALTRAREGLYLLSGDKRISRFVKELDGSYLDRKNIDSNKLEEPSKKTAIPYNISHPTTFSASSIATYIECPLKYKYQYIDKIPQKTNHYLLSGILAHSTLERCFNNKVFDIDEVKSIVIEIADELQFDSLYQKIAIVNDVQLMTTNYITDYNDQEFVPIMFEHSFDIYIDGYHFSGKIDRIDINDKDMINIIDYKTSSSYLSEKKILSDIQMGIYSYVALYELIVNGEKYDKLPDKVSIVYLRKDENKMISARFSSDDIDNIKDTINTSVKSIVSGYFEPSVGSHCKSCSFRDIICNEFN